MSGMGRQLLYIDPEELHGQMYTKAGQHILIVGATGSGKTSSLFKVIYNLWKQGETVIWRDDANLEFLSLVKVVPIKLFIPQGCRLHFEHKNVEKFYYDHKKIPDIFEHFDNEKLNVLLFDLFTVSAKVTVNFWTQFFYEIYRFKRLRLKQAWTLAIDELNDIAPGSRRGVIQDQIRLSSNLYACLPAGEIVYGLPPKPIEQIKVGDGVLTHKGRVEPVTGVFTRPYQGTLVTLNSFYNSPIRLTAEHKVFVRRYFPTGKKKHVFIPTYGDPMEVETGLIQSEMLWVEASEIKKGDFIFYPKPTGRGMNQRKYLAPVKFLPKKLKKRLVCENGHIFINGGRGKYAAIPTIVDIDPDLCRLLGYYTAEGSSSQGNVTFAFGDHEKEYIDDVITQMRRIFHLSPSVNQQGHGIKIVYSSTILCWFFSELCGKGAYNKHFPLWFLKLSLLNLENLVRGAWRGDGSGNGREHRCSYSTISNRLQVEMRMSLARLGCLSAEENMAPSGMGKHEKREIAIPKLYLPRFKALVLDDPDDLPEFQRGAFMEVGRDGKGRRGEGWWLRVREVKHEDWTGTVYHLEVNRDHTFVVGGYAVHNSCKKFRKMKLRLVGSTHNYNDLHAPLRGQFNYYIMKSMRQDMVPDRFWNYAAKIEAMKPNECLLVDRQGRHQFISDWTETTRWHVDPEKMIRLTPEQFEIPWDGEIKEEPPENYTQRVKMWKLRTMICLRAVIDLFADQGIEFTYRDVAAILDLSRSHAHTLFEQTMTIPRSAWEGRLSNSTLPTSTYSQIQGQLGRTRPEPEVPIEPS